MSPKDAADTTLAKKVAAVKAIVDAALTPLESGERNEFLGSDFKTEVFVSSTSPIAANIFDEVEKQFLWINRCTGIKSSKPIVAKNVFSASKMISVWFPNEGTTLNQLSALVAKLELLSEKPATGVKITCNSAKGTNYDLDVTKKTEKDVWAQIEDEAKARAQSKGSG